MTPEQARERLRLAEVAGVLTQREIQDELTRIVLSIGCGTVDSVLPILVQNLLPSEEIK